eukprot:363950-Chlamydomonas_euryale.AAC.6
MLVGNQLNCHQEYSLTCSKAVPAEEHARDLAVPHLGRPAQPACPCRTWHTLGATDWDRSL